MSKLDELIAEFCPDGIKHRTIGDLTLYEQPGPYIVSSTNYSEEYAIPVLTPGQSFILGYTNENYGIYPASKDNPVIIFDDFTGAFKWVDFQFKVKSSALKIIKANENISSLRYIFHLMGWLNFSSSEHKRLWISTYSGFKVPVPPKEVQNEIVRILDNFTELTAELTEELKARKKQYEYYRNKTLTFDKTIPKLALGDVVIGISSGKNKERLDDGAYPVYGSTGVISSTNNPVYNWQQILIARVGANAGLVHLADGQYDVSDNTLIVNVKKEHSLKYIYYLLQNMKLNQYAKGGGQPLITAGDIKKMIVPIPARDVQDRIVDDLDSFNAICSDLNRGLPAEINARQKQYEFYRNVLLTLKEA